MYLISWCIFLNGFSSQPDRFLLTEAFPSSILYDEVDTISLELKIGTPELSLPLFPVIDLTFPFTFTEGFTAQVSITQRNSCGAGGIFHSTQCQFLTTNSVRCGLSNLLESTSMLLIFKASIYPVTVVESNILGGIQLRLGGDSFTVARGVLNSVYLPVKSRIVIISSWQLDKGTEDEDSLLSKRWTMGLTLFLTEKVYRLSVSLRPDNRDLPTHRWADEAEAACGVWAAEDGGTFVAVPEASCRLEGLNWLTLGFNFPKGVAAGSLRLSLRVLNPRVPAMAGLAILVRPPMGQGALQRLDLPGAVASKAGKLATGYPLLAISGRSSAGSDFPDTGLFASSGTGPGVWNAIEFRLRTSRTLEEPGKGWAYVLSIKLNLGASSILSLGSVYHNLPLLFGRGEAGLSVGTELKVTGLDRLSASTEYYIGFRLQLKGDEILRFGDGFDGFGSVAVQLTSDDGVAEPTVLGPAVLFRPAARALTLAAAPPAPVAASQLRIHSFDELNLATQLLTAGSTWQMGVLAGGADQLLVWRTSYRPTTVSGASVLEFVVPSSFRLGQKTGGFAIGSNCFVDTFNAAGVSQGQVTRCRAYESTGFVRLAVSLGSISAFSSSATVDFNIVFGPFRVTRPATFADARNGGDFFDFFVSFYEDSGFADLDDFVQRSASSAGGGGPPPTRSFLLNSFSRHPGVAADFGGFGAKMLNFHRAGDLSSEFPVLLRLSGTLPVYLSVQRAPAFMVGYDNAAFRPIPVEGGSPAGWAGSYSVGCSIKVAGSTAEATCKVVKGGGSADFWMRERLMISVPTDLISKAGSVPFQVLIPVVVGSAAVSPLTFFACLDATCGAGFFATLASVTEPTTYQSLSTPLYAAGPGSSKLEAAAQRIGVIASGGSAQLSINCGTTECAPAVGNYYALTACFPSWFFGSNFAVSNGETSQSKACITNIRYGDTRCAFCPLWTPGTTSVSLPVEGYKFVAGSQGLEYPPHASLVVSGVVGDYGAVRVTRPFDLGNPAAASFFVDVTLQPTTVDLAESTGLVIRFLVATPVDLPTDTWIGLKNAAGGSLPFSAVEGLLRIGGNEWTLTFGAAVGGILAAKLPAVTAGTLEVVLVDAALSGSAGNFEIEVNFCAPAADGLTNPLRKIGVSAAPVALQLTGPGNGPSLSLRIRLSSGDKGLKGRVCADLGLGFARSEIGSSELVKLDFSGAGAVFGSEVWVEVWTAGGQSVIGNLLETIVDSVAKTLSLRFKFLATGDLSICLGPVSFADAPATPTVSLRVGAYASVSAGVDLSGPAGGTNSLVSLQGNFRFAGAPGPLEVTLDLAGTSDGVLVIILPEGLHLPSEPECIVNNSTKLICAKNNDGQLEVFITHLDSAHIKLSIFSLEWPTSITTGSLYAGLYDKATGAVRPMFVGFRGSMTSTMTMPATAVADFWLESLAWSGPDLPGRGVFSFAGTTPVDIGSAQGVFVYFGFPVDWKNGTCEVESEGTRFECWTTLGRWGGEVWLSGTASISAGQELSLSLYGASLSDEAGCGISAPLVFFVDGTAGKALAGNRGIISWSGPIGSRGFRFDPLTLAVGPWGGGRLLLRPISTGGLADFFGLTALVITGAPQFLPLFEVTTERPATAFGSWLAFRVDPPLRPPLSRAAFRGPPPLMAVLRPAALPRATVFYDAELSRASLECPSVLLLNPADVAINEIPISFPADIDTSGCDLTVTVPVGSGLIASLHSSTSTFDLSISDAAAYTAYLALGLTAPRLQVSAPCAASVEVELRGYTASASPSCRVWLASTQRFEAVLGFECSGPPKFLINVARAAVFKSLNSDSLIRLAAVASNNVGSVAEPIVFEHRVFGETSGTMTGLFNSIGGLLSGTQYKLEATSTINGQAAGDFSLEFTTGDDGAQAFAIDIQVVSPLSVQEGSVFLCVFSALLGHPPRRVQAADGRRCDPSSLNSSQNSITDTSTGLNDPSPLPLHFVGCESTSSSDSTLLETKISVQFLKPRAMTEDTSLAYNAAQRLSLADFIGALDQLAFNRLSSKIVSISAPYFFQPVTISVSESYSLHYSPRLSRLTLSELSLSRTGRLYLLLLLNPPDFDELNALWVYWFVNNSTAYDLRNTKAYSNITEPQLQQYTTSFLSEINSPLMQTERKVYRGQWSIKESSIDIDIDEQWRLTDNRVVVAVMGSNGIGSIDELELTKVIVRDIHIAPIGTDATVTTGIYLFNLHKAMIFVHLLTVLL